MTTQTGPERTVGQLVADATHDVQGIVRSEIALAKAEVSSGAKVMGKGAGLLGAAGFMALLGVIFLLHTLAQVLDIWLPISASYGIVTLVLFIVAAVLGLLGKKALDKAKPAPSRAIAEAKQTVATLKS
jgi:VIT1/CCC1 family predicted Fe2+/Mn2+ transporter